MEWDQDFKSKCNKNNKDNKYKKVKESLKDSCIGCDLMINGLCKKYKYLRVVEDCIGIIYKKTTGEL